MNKIMIYAIEAEWKIKQHALTGIILDLIPPSVTESGHTQWMFRVYQLTLEHFAKSLYIEFVTSIAKYSCRMRKVSSTPPRDKV